MTDSKDIVDSTAGKDITEPTDNEEIVVRVVEEGDDPAIKALVDQGKADREKIAALEAKNEKAEMTNLLGEIKKANLDPKKFEGLDSKQLLPIVKALADKDGSIIIPKGDPADDLQEDPTVEVWDDASQSFINWWDKKLGKKPKTE